MKEINYNEFDKECRAVCRSSYVSYASGGLVYVYASHATLYSYSNGGVRLALKTRELAEYCCKQFKDIWADYLFG